jgi:hypothetical protein
VFNQSDSAIVRQCKTNVMILLLPLHEVLVESPLVHHVPLLLHPYAAPLLVLHDPFVVVLALLLVLVHPLELVVEEVPPVLLLLPLLQVLVRPLELAEEQVPPVLLLLPLLQVLVHPSALVVVVVLPALVLLPLIPLLVHPPEAVVVVMLHFLLHHALHAPLLDLLHAAPLLFLYEPLVGDHASVALNDLGWDNCQYCLSVVRKDLLHQVAIVETVSTIANLMIFGAFYSNGLPEWNPVVERFDLRVEMKCSNLIIGVTENLYLLGKGNEGKL